MLMKKGVPGVVERTLIRPPSSKLGPIDGPTRKAVLAASPVAGKYEAITDRRSAYEILKKRSEDAAQQAEKLEEREEDMSPAEREYSAGRRYSGTRVTRSTSRTTRRSKGDSFGTAMGKMVMKELSGTTGRRIVRGILGGLFKGR